MNSDGNVERELIALFRPLFSVVSNHWTGLLDSPKCHKAPFSTFFSVGEKLIMFIQPITSLLH